MRLLTLLLTVLMLPGCQSTPPRLAWGIQHFVLEQPVAIAAGTTRTFFQQGVAKPYAAVDWYAPWCALEVRTLKETATRVQPDTFAITRVQQDEMEVAVRPDVLRLTCAGRLSNGDPQDAPDSWRPDLARINAMLGSYGRIE